MAAETYYQCTLQRGEHTTTGWIESRGAKIGAVVELLPWKVWWTVVKVFEDTGMPYHLLREYQQLNRGSLASVKAMK